MRRWLLVLVALLGLAVAVKESREPYLWLFVDDLLRPKPQPHTRSLSADLAVRLYDDTRPHTGKIARLQKGLVLLVDGRERVEEGFGFGLPLIEASGQAYLSRSASVHMIGETLVKRYKMDTLDTPSGFLRQKYVPVSPIGTVVVSYTLNAGTVGVTADFSGLEAAWDKAYLMNEQGARFFTRYEEPASPEAEGPERLVVEGERLGQWQETNARRGCMIAGDGSVQFCVETDRELPKYYGRERYNQYYWVGVYTLSWAGIDLELSAPYHNFEYVISVGRPERE